jgi:uncharacterized coiled-coil DUF342 family protein
MASEEVNKTINEYKDTINKINVKIDELQHECRHLDYDVKLIGSVPVQVKKICKVCLKDLGYPTMEELKKAGY